ncbi:MAG TPA: TasA family protein, partial [Patescibacteria group bacterium]
MIKILKSLVLLSLVAALGVSVTRSYFTSQKVLGENTLTSGTLSLDLSNDANKIVGLGNVTNLAPGDIANPASITITNNGSMNLDWVGRFLYSGDPALTHVIYIKEMQMDFLRPNSTSWETTDHFISNGKGSGSYPDAFNAMASHDPLGVISLDTWKNYNSIMIPTTDFFMGALKPGYQYRLTFTLAMSPDATSTYQGRSMGLSFQANATQTNLTALNSMLNGLVTGLSYSDQGWFD